MKPSVNRDQVVEGIAVQPRPAEESGPWLVPAALMVFSVLAYGQLGERLGGGAALAAGAVAYALSAYVYYGIARLAYETHALRLGSAVLAGGVAAYLLAGYASLWLLVTGWAMLLSAGSVTGRMTRAGYRPGQVYLLGAVVVVLLFSIQSWPLWSRYLSSEAGLTQSLLDESRQLLEDMGHSAEYVETALEQLGVIFGLMVHFFPAAALLGALVPFSIGYLAFTRWIRTTGRPGEVSLPFVMWRVPFGLTPVLLVAAVLRILGGELLRLAADNILAILATYYCLAGLALMEYYLKRLQASRLMKVGLYLLLFFTQLVGFLTLALVGFIDSFADFRNRSVPQAA